MTHEKAKKLADVLDYLYDNNCYDDLDNLVRLTNAVKYKNFIRAFAENKCVLILDKYTDMWHKMEDTDFNDVPNNMIFNDDDIIFKIENKLKIEPLCEMIPYTFETAVKDNLLSKTIISLEFGLPSQILYMNKFGIYRSGNKENELITYENLFKQYTFDDGTKCGINQYKYVNDTESSK
jgi:hypothetical protein